jgi:hypothetical protein
MTKILIIDPLTLIGRETLELLAADPILAADVGYLHTGMDDEHQIAELAGEPALVPPLDDLNQLSDAGAIVVTSEVTTPRLERIPELASSRPDIPIVIAGRLPGIWDQFAPAAGVGLDPMPRQVRLAHPALVILWTLVGALRYLDPISAVMASLEPVSAGGADDIERLARQAAQRLQGAVVEERIADEILAFTLVAADDEDLNRDAASLLPSLETAVTRTATGCFHGHAALIGIGFSSQVEEHEVLEALRDDERLGEPDLPLRLDACAGTDVIALSVPRLSPGGRLLSITAMVDGLRVGGARTALDILRSMI